MGLHRWIWRGAAYDLALFLVSFLLPLGGAHYPVGPALVLGYVNWPSWWLMHQLIDDPGGDASQMGLYCTAVLLNGAAYGGIVWMVIRFRGAASSDDLR